MLDLGDVVAPDRVREAFEATVRYGYYDHTEALSLIARSTGRHGLKPLLALIAEKDTTHRTSAPAWSATSSTSSAEQACPSPP
jgi:hypothetical protein